MCLSRQIVCLTLLKPRCLKSQHPAVLRHGSHNMIRCTLRDIGLDLNRHAYTRAHQPREMLHDFIRDMASVTVKPSGVEALRAAEPT